MSYTEEAVTSKLTTLNESQDSIVTVSQWIMFHRRQAPKTASVWFARLRDSPTLKRLNLLYLANEVVQQSRARHKSEFLHAFEPLMVDASALAYERASQEVQGKVRRMVQVWRTRAVFDAGVVEGIERRLGEMDREKAGKVNGGGGPAGGKLGGSLFGGGGRGGDVPAELQGVAKSLAKLGEVEAAGPSAVETGMREFEKITDPDAHVPTPPLYCARLSNVVKALATAEGAVEASITTRKELLTELEKLVEKNRTELAEKEPLLSSLKGSKDRIEAMKKDVEDYIMQGLSHPSSPNATPPPPPSFANQANGITSHRRSSRESKTPEAQAQNRSFTPPPPDVETLTPPSAPEPEFGLIDATDEEAAAAPFLGSDTPAEKALAITTGAEDIREYAPNFTEPAPAHELPPALQPTDPSQTQDSTASASARADDFLNSLNVSTNPNANPSLGLGVGGGGGQVRQASMEIPEEAVSRDPRLKRRKTGHEGSPKREQSEEDAFAAGMLGMDEEGVTAALLDS